MESLRQLMGFLLAAAAVWLFYVLAAQISPEQLAFFQLALLGLALTTWLFRQAQGRPVGRKVAGVGMLAAAVLGVALVAGAGPAPDASAAPEKSGRIAWVPFDESQAHALAADGNLVFVDVTADWCLTCKTNERLVIETEEVASAFETHGVVPMKADWTNRDDEIADFLARFGRSSIPFYVLYRPERQPHPFGVLLTKGQILDVLEESSQLADAGGGAGELAGAR
jgi:thiol:disulfide interchange protein